MFFSTLHHPALPDKWRVPLLHFCTCQQSGFWLARLWPHAWCAYCAEPFADTSQTFSSIPHILSKRPVRLPASLNLRAKKCMMQILHNDDRSLLIIIYIYIYKSIDFSIVTESYTGVEHCINHMTTSWVVMFFNSHPAGRLIPPSPRSSMQRSGMPSSFLVGNPFLRNISTKYQKDSSNLVLSIPCLQNRFVK